LTCRHPQLLDGFQLRFQIFRIQIPLDPPVLFSYDIQGLDIIIQHPAFV
jgi:hypothetical protein